jgi:RHS repeat-associated protein
MSTALRTYFGGHDLTATVGPGASNPRYYHFDHQGTTQALTDTAGAVTDRFASDAWGVEVKRTGSSINRCWYIGSSHYYTGDSSKRCYVRSRWLEVALARWVSADRVPDEHKYAYVNDNPIRHVDPLGQQGVQCTASAFLVQSQDASKPPNPPFVGGRGVLFTRVIRICAELTCYVSMCPSADVRCPSEGAMKKYKFCQSLTGNASRGRPNIPFISLGVGPGFYCPDTRENQGIYNDPSRAPLSSGNCIRTNWVYAGAQLPPSLVASYQYGNTKICKYVMCMYDAPGERDSSLQNVNNCYETVNPGLYRHKRVSQRDLPYQINLLFRSWVCDNDATGSEVSNVVAWWFNVKNGGANAQVTAGGPPVSMSGTLCDRYANTTAK